MTTAALPGTAEGPPKRPAAGASRAAGARPILVTHCDVQLTRDLAIRLDRAATTAAITRSALVRAILSTALPTLEEDTA